MLSEQFTQIMSYSFWQYTVFGNTLFDYTFAGLIFLGLVLALRLFQSYIIHRLENIAEKTKTDLDDTFIAIVNSLQPPFYIFIAVFVGVQFIQTNQIIETIILVILVSWSVYQAIIAAQILIDYIVMKRLGEEEEESARSIINLLSIISKVVLWALGILFVLSNLGVNVTSLIAGLGVGGLAVALALQNILGDLFSSLSIFFDKPFKVGDFVIIGDDLGVVERIGIKTTRIRALEGEELVVSNQELTSTRIQNYGKMQDRRVSFELGVTYDTDTEKLRRITEIIENIITDKELVRFDRSHFKSFGDFALVFETVYFVDTADYAQYMDIQQEILLAIKDHFNKASIELAFPTQTIYLAKDT